MKLYNSKDRILLGGAIAFGGITAALSAFVSILLQRIIDVSVAGDTQGFSRILKIVLIYLAALGIMGFLEAIIAKLLVRNVTVHLRERIFRGIMDREPESYASQNTADYLSALINDVKLAEENYLIPLLLCTQMAVLFVATLGILFYLSPAVTIILIGFLGLVLAVPALLGKKLQKRQDVYSEQLSVFTAGVKDFFNGFEVIRGYSAYGYIQKRFLKINKNTADKKFSADALMAVNESFSDIFSSLVVIVIVFVAAWQLMEGKITMGTLLALIQLSGTFVTPVVILLQNLPKIQGIKPVLQHLEQLMAKDTEKHIPSEKNKEKEEKASGTLQASAGRKGIVCSGLTYGYSDRKMVLNKADFVFQPGKKYAVTGPSGCGKSTLIKLLTGYSHEFGGEILLDGQPVQEMTQKEINRRIAVIHQNVFLFDLSVRDNICLGETYSLQEIQEALRDSGMCEFVEELENGIDSPVGENGNLLSGGQRQRIALARALIRKTPVLILDEGTSAIDKDTAFAIEEKLLNCQDLTLITITHHLDKRLKGCYDQIIAMQI